MVNRGFSSGQEVPALRGIADIVAACELVRNGDADSVTVSIPMGDKRALLPIVSEMADQADVDLELRDTSSGLSLTLRRRARGGQS